MSSPCSKSPHAHITERPRKNESEARVLIWRRTRFVRGRLITKILHLSERVTHLHIAVPTKTRSYASRIHVLKSNNKLNCKFEFRLNCKQRLMFHQGTINDNKFISVDAAQRCLCRSPTNCLFSMNKSARRCVLSNDSVKHDKSV